MITKIPLFIWTQGQLMLPSKISNTICYITNNVTIYRCSSIDLNFFLSFRGFVFACSYFINITSYLHYWIIFSSICSSFRTFKFKNS